MGQTHPFLCRRHKPTQTENPNSEPNTNQRKRGCRNKDGGQVRRVWRDGQTYGGGDRGVHQAIQVLKAQGVTCNADARRCVHS